MKKKPLRVYADTSVFGGAFDAEFKSATRAFFAQVQDGHFILVVSPVVRGEVAAAPAKVRELYEQLLPVMDVGYRRRSDSDCACLRKGRNRDAQLKE